MSGNANGRATVRNTGREVAYVTCLVVTSQPKIVVITVNGKVFVVTLRQLLNRSIDSLNTSGFAHLLGRVVRVAACAVPVALKGFRVEGNLYTPLLCNSNEEIASDPEFISHGNTVARANLEFPLRRHNFGVDATDPDASIKTGTIVSFDQIAGNDPSGA